MRELVILLFCCCLHASDFPINPKNESASDKAIDAAVIQANIQKVYAAAIVWRDAKYSVKNQTKWTKDWEKQVADNAGVFGEETYTVTTFDTDCSHKKEWAAHPEKVDDKNLFPFVMLFCRIVEKQFAFLQRDVECLTAENTEVIVKELKRRGQN